MSEDAAPPLRVAVQPVTPLQQNCSLVWCTETGRGAIIDPGGDILRIRNMADRHKVQVEKILVTHGHLDHAGAVARLAEEYGVPIEGPQRADSYWIDQMESQGAQYGMPGVRHFTPTRWLEDGDTVTVGNQTLEVIHCPGHTPGHVVFFHRPSRFAVVGDVLFQGSIGRTDFPMGDHGALIRSIREKLFPLGDDITFLPGHGDLSTFGQERQTNPFVSDRAVGRG
jgi:glyoxylase-like metal-dependent hydrolase (beta-lactamase superfamily II)